MFRLIDAARREVGMFLEEIGLGPAETPYRIVAELEAARLRAYRQGRADGRPALLIVAAPFKRPYIWDLAPSVSVIRRCLAHDVPVYLLEWRLAGAEQDDLGLADYADQIIAVASEAIRADSGCAALVIAGHSLGGTFAAIFAGLHPECVRGLLLIDAPIDFGEGGGPIARMMAAMPHARSLRLLFGSPVPGSAINLLCASAMPAIFLWQPVADLVASLPDDVAAAIHMRVVRWMMDEFPLPGRLFEEILEHLYRDNRFVRGSLEVSGRSVGVEGLRCPVLAVVNPAGGVVPPASVLAAVDMGKQPSSRILTYQAVCGPALQHVGPLVAPGAHERLWPEIIGWIEERG